MEKFAVHEIIEQAVQTERLGHDFYSRMAGKFERNTGLKKLFDMLAVKELQHEKRFSDLRQKTGELFVEDDELVSSYLRALVESEFFLGNNKSLPSLDHIETVGEAVGFALGFEKETLLYYYGLRDMVKEKEIVNEIIDEEKRHVMWLSEFREQFV
ncbi:MAG: ferritin family protein [Nitrospirae bacterium]|nr:ferritin family protein [Nitrospirota bacterium]